MNDVETIVCKPTRWFLFRAWAMLLMFAVFAVWFYRDGSVGYRKQNEAFFLRLTFEQADKEFGDRPPGQTPAQWRAYASQRTVLWPEDISILPAGTPGRMPWPEILQDYERMKTRQWQNLWREYSATRGFDVKGPEKPFDAGSIREQWIVCWICLALALLAAFFLIRTLRRSIRVDAEAVTDQRGRRVPFADMRVLDLRKWGTKGLAFIDYDGTAGRGRLRIDGLTYGGFKPEDHEPAERLMRRVRESFSGEIIEFASAEAEEPPAGDETEGPADEDGSAPAESSTKND